MNQSKFIDVPNLHIPASQKIAAKLKQQQQPRSKVQGKSRYRAITASTPKGNEEESCPEVPPSPPGNTRFRPTKSSDIVVTGCICLSSALLFALCVLAGFQAYFLSKVAGIDEDGLRGTKTETAMVTRTEWVASKTETTTKIVSVIASATAGAGEYERSVALRPSQTESMAEEVQGRGGKGGVKPTAFTA